MFDLMYFFELGYDLAYKSKPKFDGCWNLVPFGRIYTKGDLSFCLDIHSNVMVEKIAFMFNDKIYEMFEPSEMKVLKMVRYFEYLNEHPNSIDRFDDEWRGGTWNVAQ